MADLLVPGGDTERPWAHPPRAAGDGSLGDGATPDGAGLEHPPQEPGIAIAQVPDWVIQQVDQVAYPTRMARRRALEAARIEDGWQPDPHITTPVLGLVEHGLARLPEPDLLPASPRAQTRPLGRLLDPLLGRLRTHRRIAVATAVVLALLVGAIGWSALGHGGGSKPSAAPVAAHQQVVALALASGTSLTGVSLLASGSAGIAGPQQVLVPSRLLLDVPGAGRLPVAQSLAPGPSAPGAAIADALQIKVAGTWVLGAAALGTLVDSVGGVTVDVDVDVTKGSGAGAAILVAAGPSQHLSGTQAAAYAQLLVGDEPEAARLARQERVVTALLAALPADAAQRRAFVVGLPGAPKGAVLDAVLAVTGDLHDAAAKGAIGSTVVPVKDIDTGGAVTAYGLDSSAAAAMVKTRLPGAALAVPPGGRLRVLVQNGDGRPGLGDAARSKLVAAGLRYVGGGNVSGFGVRQSVVLLPDGSSASRAKGLSVTKALGLPDSALRISDSSPTVADLVVMLGSDFRTE